MTSFVKFIWRYKFTIACLFYFCLISILALYIVSKPALINALSFVLILNILSKTKYSLWLSLILSFFVSFDAYFAFVYSNQASIGTVASIFETNPSEAFGVLKDAIFPIVLIFCFSTFLIIMSEKELKNSSFSRNKSIILLLFYWLIVMPALGYWKVRSLKYENFIANFPIIGVQSVIAANFPLVYGDIATYIAYRHEMYQMRQFQKIEKKMPNGMVLDKNKVAPQKIFFVIGESASSMHYSLYGYEFKTTPFLDSLSRVNPSAMFYYDAYAPAVITRDALRITLSFSTPQDIKPFFQNYNLIDLANKAGYETIWISNQDRVGESDSYIGFVSSNAKDSYYEKDFRKEDFKLLSYVKQAYKANEKQFFVIHLNGSHVPYNQRYDEVDLIQLPGKNTLTAEYDRSIHHTDRFLRKLYEIIKEENSSIMYYYSDHGEAVEKGGHGVFLFDQELFDIPLITVNNSSVMLDSITKKYIDPETSKINTSNSIYILSEIMGYNVTNEDVNRAINEGKYIYQVDNNVYPYSKIYSK